MISANDGIAVDHHDWHSQDYVDEWIARDITRDEERRLRLRQMLAAAPFAADAEITVLDVGGGYGVVTEEVLRVFPRAVVTLQDYSQPMLDQARDRLAAYCGRVEIRGRRSARPGMDDGARRPVRPRGLGDRDPQPARSRTDRRLLSRRCRGAEARWRLSRLRSVRSDRRDRRPTADDPGGRLCRGRLPVAGRPAGDHPRRAAAPRRLSAASRISRSRIVHLRVPLVCRMVACGRAAASPADTAPCEGTTRRRLTE